MSNDMVTVYKIRDKNTGKFSSGRGNPTWSTNGGKTWNTLGPLKNHLNMYCKRFGRDEIVDLPESWEIVKLEVKYEDLQTIPARTVSDNLKKRHEICKKYGYKISNALDQLDDIDFSEFRYLFVLNRFYWSDNGNLKILQNLGIKKSEYRSRRYVAIFRNHDDAVAVRLSMDNIEKSIDLDTMDELNLK